MVKRLFSLATIALIALIALAACGGNNESDNQTRIPVSNAPTPPAKTPTAAAAASPQASPAASPHASPAASPKASPPASPPPPSGNQPPPPTAVTVDLVDIAFQPKEITIPANTDVKVTVTNKGVLPHTFTIDALGVDTGAVATGETKDVTINAQPGEYEYYCTEPGHKDAGMFGTLTVK